MQSNDSLPPEPINPTEEDITWAVKKLTELNEYLKTAITPLPKARILCNEKAIDSLDKKLTVAETERKEIYTRLLGDNALTVGAGLFPGLNFLNAREGETFVRELLVEGEVSKNIFNLANILCVSKILLDKFKDQGIKVFPRILLEGQGHVDIFVKFPAPLKKYIMLALVPVGKDESIYFNTEKQKLHTRNKKKSNRRKDFDLKKVEALKVQEPFLREKHQNLFGTKADAKKSIAKVLTLCNPYQDSLVRNVIHESKFKMKFNEESLGTLEGNSFLILTSEPTVFLTTEESIGSFVSSWILS